MVRTNIIRKYDSIVKVTIIFIVKQVYYQLALLKPGKLDEYNSLRNTKRLKVNFRFTLHTRPDLTQRYTEYDIEDFLGRLVSRNISK